MTLTVGGLCSGVGGIELGLRRAGMQIEWMVEIDPFCQRVLEKHWPDVPRYGDMRDVGRYELKSVDLICGGFPCPVVSCATRGRSTGEWLWPEFARIVHELSPRWVLVENVNDGGAWRCWLPIVRRDLWRLGYTSLPLRLRASQFGAPFRGTRIYVVATTHGDGESISALHEKASELQESTGFSWTDWGKPSSRALGVADRTPHKLDDVGGVEDARASVNRGNRIRAVGRAVVPQIAEWLGRLILEVEALGG